MRTVEGRWLCSRDFVNGWVWSTHFLSIPEEGGAVTVEGVGTLKESLSLSRTTSISGRLFKDLGPQYQPPKGGSVSILFVAVVSLKK